MSVSWSDLADALFPDVELSIQDYIQQYPERDVPVTRFAPSPTGFCILVVYLVHFWRTNTSNKSDENLF
jgi:hypothetical protein